MFKVKINGVTHEVTTGEDGEMIYDPPRNETKQQILKRRKALKEMCDSMTPPSVQSDTTFHKGRGTLLDQMEGDDAAVHRLTEKAKARGYTPGANDVYISQLADSLGDPKAFFKPSEGRAELKKRLEQTGKGVDMPGMRVESKPFDEKKRPALNPRIAKNLARGYRESGEHSNKSDSELLQHVVKKHGRAVE